MARPTFRTRSSPDSTGSHVVRNTNSKDRTPSHIQRDERVLKNLQDLQQSSHPPAGVNATSSPQLTSLTEEHSRTVESLTRLWSAVQSQRPKASSPPLEDEGEMQIGLTRLTIPPERVHVAEVPQLEEVGGLRTDTTTLIKTGKGRIQITLDIPFEGKGEINSKLREIIAQFRSYPYVPVVSHYLARIIQPKVQRPLTGEQAKSLATRRQDAARGVAEGKDAYLKDLNDLLVLHADLRKILEADPNFRAARVRLASISSLDEINAAFTETTQLLRRHALSVRTGSAVVRDVQATAEKMNTHLDDFSLALMNLERLQFQEIHAAVGGLIDTDAGVVPCCLDTIQARSVPGQPNLIRTTLSLVYFNPIPYGGILAYRDIFGEATIDPGQAIFMRQQIQRWLTLPAPPDLPHGQIDRSSPNPAQDALMRKESLNTIGLGLLDPESASDGGLVIGYYTTDIVAEAPADTNKRTQDGGASITEKVQAQSPRARILDLSTTRRGVIVRYVSVSLGNRLATQPIPGEFYPSMQYLGARPARITVEMAVTDQDVLSEIHAMKIANQQLSTLGIRHWRRPEVHLRNGLINLFGIWTAQIDDITTESVSPDTTSMKISFVEHRVDSTSGVIERPQLFSQTTLEKALRFLFTHAQRYFISGVGRMLATQTGLAFTKEEAQALFTELNSVRTAAGQDPIAPEEITAALELISPATRAHEQAAAEILFGTEDGKERGIITPETIRKAFFLERPESGAQELIRSEVLRLHDAVAGVFAVKGSKGDQSLIQSLLIFDRYRGKSLDFKERYDHRKHGAPGDMTWDSHFLLGDEARGYEVHEVGRPINPFFAHVPTDSEITWLTGFLARSAGNITDELDLSDENPDQVTITSRTGADKTLDFLAMTRLARAILHDEVRPPNEDSIRTIVLGSQTTIRDFLANIRDFPSLLYRDLGLPTYDVALAPVLAAIENNRRAKNHEQGISQDATIKSVRDLSAEERAVISRFIPNYRSIGQIPRTEEENLDDFAYDFKDTVLPDFPYFGRNRAAIFSAFRQLVETHGGKGDSTLKRKREEGSETLPNVPHDPLDQRRSQRFFDEDQIATNRPSPTKPGTEVASLSLENPDVLLTEAYSPGRFRANVEDFGVDTPQVTREIFDAAVASEEDAHLTLRKCFPTFRVFFIEEDTQEGTWRAIDDVYGYNAVISLSITRDKYNPDIAILVLMNLEGALETDKFSTADRDTPEGPIKKNPRAEGGLSATNPRVITEIAGPIEKNTGERVLRKFPLREGTRIAVQLGYHSRPDYLVTVFTGKIAEVQFGDMVRVTAQSYLQELLFPIVQNPPTESPAGIIELMLDSPTVEHFGRWTPFSFEKLSAIEMHNAAANSSLASAVREDLRIFFADPKLRNVFVAKYSNWWSRTLSQRLFEDHWDIGGGQKTAWDVIQDVINYSPGWIAAVVPYDLEATLFVGRPEQPYFWTDGLRKEEQRYIRTRARRELQVGRDAPRLLNSFQQSKYWHGNIRGEAGLRRDAEDRNLELHDELRLLGRTFPAWTLVLETKNLAALTNLSLAPSTIEQLAEIGLDPNKLGRPSDTLKVNLDLDELARLPAGEFLGELLQLVGGTEVDYADIAVVMLEAVQGGDSVLRNPNATTLQLKTHLFDFATALGALKFVPDPIAFYSEIWSGKDVTRARINQAIETRAGVWTEVRTANVNLTALANFLYIKRGFIPIFFQALRNYFKTDPLTSLARTIRSKTRKWPLNPRMRPFRQYHLISSFEDMIENQIACTRGAMWNGVQISKGEGTPLLLWADDGIVKGDRILMAFNEPNADLDIFNVSSLVVPAGDFVANQYLVGFSRLAQGLRPMYRGQIVCRGRPDIKPWDICHLADYHNLMFGPIEVERVTHHFSAETGFVTTITPHLVAIANNHIDSFGVMKAGWLYGGVASAGVVLVGGLASGLLLASGVGALVAVGVGFALAGAGDVVADEILKEGTGTGIVGNFIGNGIHGGLKMPIKIIPLMRMGTPWVAGLRGFGRSTKTGIDDVIGLVYERLKAKTLDVGSALAFFWDQLGEVRQGLTHVDERREKDPNFGK